MHCSFADHVTGVADAFWLDQHEVHLITGHLRELATDDDEKLVLVRMLMPDELTR